MSNGVRGYLAGVCHGAVVVGLLGYILWRAGGSLDALFAPRDGLLPAPLLMLPVFASMLLLQRNALRAAAPTAARGVTPAG